MILEECQQCGKMVGDDEWVTNWGSCDACFDRHFEAYELGQAFIVSMGGYSSQFPEGL